MGEFEENKEKNKGKRNKNMWIIIIAVDPFGYKFEILLNSWAICEKILFKYFIFLIKLARVERVDGILKLTKEVSLWFSLLAVDTCLKWLL